MQSLQMEALDWITIGNRESPWWIKSLVNVCCWHELATSRSPRDSGPKKNSKGFPWGKAQSHGEVFFWTKCGCWQGVHKVSTRAFYPWMLKAWRLLPTETAPPKLAKPGSLIQLYITNTASLFSCLQQPCISVQLCPVYVINTLRFRDAAASPTESPEYTYPSFLSVCPLSTLVRSFLGGHAGHH